MTEHDDGLPPVEITPEVQAEIDRMKAARQTETGGDGEDAPPRAIVSFDPMAEPAPTPGALVQQGREAKPPVSVGARGYVVPTNIDEAYRYAVAVWKSNTAPSSYKSPNDVMIGILAAQEAGLPPMYGLRQIAIINNRPTIWGDAAMALIHNSGKLAGMTVVEVDADFDRDATPLNDWPNGFGIVVTMWRKGQGNPYIGKFTVGDARRAKLWLNAKKAPWMEHPLRMLMSRARAFPQRDGFADALAGLSIREEVEDYAATAAPTDASFLDDAPQPALPAPAEPPIDMEKL